jgi:hypothetical protein
LIAVGRARRTFSSSRGGALFKLLVGLAVLFAAGALAWMLFLPAVVTAQLRSRTGFDATVQSLAVNPFTGRVELRGLLITNPPTFPEHEFIELRGFSANAEVFSLLSDRPVFTSLVVDVASVTLVVRPDGQTNATAFQHHLASDGDGVPRPPSPPQKFLIRHLTLRADRLLIVDHTNSLPVSHEYHLGLNQNYTDVTDLRQLLSPTALQSLAPVGLALKGLVPGELGDAIGDAVKGAGKAGTGFFKTVGHKAGEKVKGFFDALEESRKP